MVDSVKFNPPIHGRTLGIPNASNASVISMGSGVLTMLGGIGLGHPILGLEMAAVGATAALVQIGEYRMAEWVPILARHGRERITGRYRYLEDGSFPAPLDDTAILAWPIEDETVAVVRRGSTYSMVLECTSRSPTLADDHEIDSSIEAWADLQRQICLPSNHIARLSWVESAGPSDPLGAIRWYEKNLAIPEDHEFAEGYKEAISEASCAVTHVIHLMAQLDIRRKATARAVRASGGGDLGACRVLERTVDWFRGKLHGMQRDSKMLTPDALRVVCRKRFDPGLSPSLAMLGKTAKWNPGGTLDAWDHYRADGFHHITAKVVLPEHPVGTDFLWPLLMSSEHYRTVACVIDTTDPRKAISSTERDVTTSSMVGEVRERSGVMPTLRSLKKDQAASEREEEISAGHRGVTVGMYVSVSAKTLEDAEVAYADIETDASLSSIDLQRRYGQQRDSFLCTLPLGRRA